MEVDLAGRTTDCTTAGDDRFMFELFSSRHGVGVGLVQVRHTKAWKGASHSTANGHFGYEHGCTGHVQKPLRLLEGTIR